MTQTPEPNPAHQAYQAALFTQLVLNGVAVPAAMERATEATELLTRYKLPYPPLVVG